MKKFLFVLFGVFAFSGAFAAGENVPTSKSYVDSKLGEKQDTIPANDGATQVLTNTGTAGEYGTKGIYDATGAYAAQTQNLVDAAAMNAGVQNAINSEFQCIEWVDPNDHSSECLLFNIFGETERRSPNLFDANLYPDYYTSSTGSVRNNGNGIFSVQGNTVNTGKRLFQVAPGLVVGKNYTLNFKTTGTEPFFYFYYNNGTTGLPTSGEIWRREQSKQMTEQLLNAIVYFYGRGGNPEVTISDIQITEGTTAVPYVPYGNIYLPTVAQ